MQIGLLYEHPTWSRELIELLRSRGHDVDEINVANHRWDATATPPPCDVWVNRVNAMPSDPRAGLATISSTRNLLAWLEINQQTVMNGLLTHQLGASKVAQAGLFSQARAATPTTIPIRQIADAMEAADDLGYPVITKPNAGGSGTGVQRFGSATELRAAVDGGLIDLGPDGTGLVQSAIESAEGQLYRIELLDGELLYATGQALQEGSFNYCAADGCSTAEGGAGSIALCVPDPEALAAARRIVRAADAAIASVEYLIDAATGSPTFIDFNPFSNLVTGLEAELGFSPLERLAEAIEGHALTSSR